LCLLLLILAASFIIITHSCVSLLINDALFCDENSAAAVCILRCFNSSFVVTDFRLVVAEPNNDSADDDADAD